MLCTYGYTFVCFYTGKYTAKCKKKKDYHINDLEINLKKTLCVSSLRMKQEIIAEEDFKNTDSQKLNQAQR